MLYVLGDSHTMYFTGKLPGSYAGADPSNSSLTRYFFDEVDTGPRQLRVLKLSSTGPTMRGLANPNSHTGANVSAKGAIVQEDARDVMFVLGEVDCREHIVKKENLDEDVHSTLVRFEDFRATLPPLRSLGLFGVCPPQRELVRSRKLHTLPYVIATFNDALREYCVSRGYRFVSIYRDVVDDCGFLRPEYASDDGNMVHLVPAMAYPVVMDHLERVYRGA